MAILSQITKEKASMAKTTLIHCNNIPINITRSQRRKTMALQIRNGQAYVRIPSELPLEYVHRFISKKQHWITQNIAEQQAALPNRQFIDGELLPFLGETLELQFQQAGKNDIIKKQDQLTIRMASNQSSTRRRQRVEAWLRQQASSHFEQRVNALSKRTELLPSSLKVRSYRARWGSCSIHGDIKLNWKLIMAPPHIIDYVIIHELCHLNHHNHSAAFWQLVDQFDPNRKINRNWLKEHSLQLEL